MKTLTKPQILPVVAFLGFAGLFLSGCGWKESSESENRIVAAPTSTPASAPQSGSSTTAENEVDFASLDSFPDLAYSVSEDLSPNGNKICPLVSGNRILDESGNIRTTYWAANVPATFEITLPVPATIHRIEVLGPGGTLGIPECVVFIKRSTTGKWERPPNLNYRKVWKGFDEDGDMTNHVFSFPEMSAAAVLLGFAQGCERYPELVQVRNISIFGHPQKP